MEEPAISIGVSVFRRSPASLEVLITEADATVYEIKTGAWSARKSADVPQPPVRSAAAVHPGRSPLLVREDRLFAGSTRFVLSDAPHFAAVGGLVAREPRCVWRQCEMIPREGSLL